jgi:hypothetical protein
MMININHNVFGSSSLSGSPTMPQVTLDIAGMYFSESVTVPEGATIKDLMDAVVTKTNPPLGNNKASFNYRSEKFDDDSKQINTITITHRGGSAKSRQTKGGQGTGRTYPNGIYSYTDDAVKELLPNKPLRAANPNQNAILAWQYYVYDAEGRDLARAAGASRKIVPFDAPPSDGGYSLGEGYTVVWRLITICVRSTHGDLGELTASLAD